jgi:hypothetical protein
MLHVSGAALSNGIVNGYFGLAKFSCYVIIYRKIILGWVLNLLSNLSGFSI